MNAKLLHLLWIYIFTALALSQTEKASHLGYIYCADTKVQQSVPVYLESCMSLHVGNFVCGQKVDVVEGSGTALKIVTSDGITRYVNASAVSEKSNEMVPISVQTGPAPECKTAHQDPSKNRHSRVVFDREPDYPEPFRRSHKEGSVTVALLVGTDGLPREVKVVSSSDKGFERNAVEAVRQWRFEPAMRDGRPTDERVEVIVDFHLFR